MIISIWRYSHLILAVSSSLFLLIATLTGAILALEPIEREISNENNSLADKVTITETIYNLKNHHSEIIHIEIDEINNVIVGFINEDGNLENAFINPTTGSKIGNPKPRAGIYNFATSLHRSLFFKKIGRFFVGLTSFLLFLLSISGIFLILKRQGGIRNFFSKVTDQSIYQYLHVILGRLAFIPIIIITLTGVYLSLEKFELIPTYQKETSTTEEILSTIEYNKQDFTFFNTTTLGQVKNIEFPFSDSIDDFYTITLLDKEVLINQQNGAIVAVNNFPFTKIASYYSLLLHTGQGNAIWSLLLLLTCFAILYFIYSGFKISINRRKKSKTLINIYTKDTAKYVILFGSENGTTYAYAKAFYKALIKANKRVFIDQLNNYTRYDKAENLIIFTATYGEGDAPSNASSFNKLIKKIKQPSVLNFTILGFGSKSYPDYCKYAIELDTVIDSLDCFKKNTNLHKINNQSYKSFLKWLKIWCVNNNLNIQVKQPKEVHKDNKVDMKIIERTTLNVDDTFLIKLKPIKRMKFKSGDLLAITPDNDLVKRYYSISRNKKNILLSVKKHEHGLVSNILYELNINTNIDVEVIQKPDFYFPSKAKEIICIGNGTGVAPFIGMLDEIRSKQSVYMYLGLRTKESFAIYEPFFKNSKLKNLNIAYSQEKEKEYVQDLLYIEKEILKKCIENKGTIMICGSIKMQKDVLQLIDTMCLTHNSFDSQYLIDNNRLKMDCY